jgi:manganese-transporting P-type ATPase
VFSLSACPTDLKLTHYTASTGINTESEITKTLERWGKNHLAVQTPSFLELLQNQLLSPLAMFQVFCALLWLLDEYWSYTAWSLVSVVVFETTTVFQRTRTQKVLGTKKELSPISLSSRSTIAD